MIARIGDFVLNATCAELKRLNLRAGGAFSSAVNVSARQLAKPSCRHDRFGDLGSRHRLGAVTRRQFEGLLIRVDVRRD